MREALRLFHLCCIPNLNWDQGFHRIIIKKILEGPLTELLASLGLPAPGWELPVYLWRRAWRR